MGVQNPFSGYANPFSALGAAGVNYPKYIADVAQNIKDVQLVACNMELIKAYASMMAYPLVGTTADRPTGLDTGKIYFDTTLGQPIWVLDGGWVDAMGTPV